MRRMNRTLAFSLLALVGLSTIAAVKIKNKATHLGVSTKQVVYLSSFNVENDNTGGDLFYYDRNYNGGHALQVPEGYSFLVTDIFVAPSGVGVDSDAQYLVVVNLTTTGTRTFSARFSGTDTRHYPLAGGMVIPAGAEPSARNTTYSSGDVEVRLAGYFVKGPGLQGGEVVF